MSRAKQIQILALGGSAGLLLGALAFQYIGGLSPCALCIWQRWPHVVALVAGLGLVVPGPWAWLGALGAGASGAIGVYHTGVERDWWQGPASCTSGGDLSGLSAQELLDQIMAAPVVRCDDIAWELLGLSMASWNAILSFGLAALWVLSTRLRG
ncbi:disulfide bond formation protein B [Roseibaca sp. Y0-43]|uniref:disulfide bond formation protein B n=1 Tax=Roseibaca sp. Y0-43 TaxID=2816854 RepID=UPI001D0CA064|nr:disulfide bond formation protein B [Roseibaca sp. Y0-43]